MAKSFDSVAVQSPFDFSLRSVHHCSLPTCGEQADKQNNTSAALAIDLTIEVLFMQALGFFFSIVYPLKLLSSTKSSYFVTNHNACITPGIKNNKLNNMFINKSLPTPLLKKTATGGNRIAKMIKTNLFIFILQCKHCY